MAGLLQQQGKFVLVPENQAKLKTFAGRLTSSKMPNETTSSEICPDMFKIVIIKIMIMTINYDCMICFSTCT